MDELPGNVVIWRYMAFEKFVSMLESHSLWFSRPFAFDDRWEGLYPPSYYKNARQWAVRTGEKWDDDLEMEFIKRWKRHRYASFVNCWHIADNESDAMWRLYGEGVAIRSTVGRLRSCLSIHGCGRVIYYDPEKDLRYKSIFGPPDILHKRVSFIHENECRAWICDDALVGRIERNEEVIEEELSRGMMMSIHDMQKLIDKVTVAPNVNAAFFERIRDICLRCKRQWLADKVVRSRLEQPHSSFFN